MLCSGLYMAPTTARQPKLVQAIFSMLGQQSWQKLAESKPAYFKPGLKSFLRADGAPTIEIAGAHWQVQHACLTESLNASNLQLTAWITAAGRSINADDRTTDSPVTAQAFW